MRKIIEILAQLIISTTIFAGVFYAALPKYDHEEAQNTLRNHFTIMFRVQQGLGKFKNEIFKCDIIRVYQILSCTYKNAALNNLKVLHSNVTLSLFC